MQKISELRVQAVNRKPIHEGGDFVLYWMIANRRAAWNHALQRALEWAAELKKPLLVLEALRVGYPWASDRLHRFVLQGMADNASRFATGPVLHYPFVETTAGSGRGLLAALGSKACLVVTDDYPCFFLPRMVAAAAKQLDVRLEQVDANGLLPLRAADHTFPSAYTFRRFLQKELSGFLHDLPKAQPLRGLRLPRLESLPKAITARWPVASKEMLQAGEVFLRSLPIDHGVLPGMARGGTGAAEDALQQFLQKRLRSYGEKRNSPEEDVTSGLSPYLHFGHISAHQVFAALSQQEGWSMDRLAAKATGKRSGWWGVSEPAEAFLDQLVTWRELGFNFASRTPGYDELDSLPDWARKTLQKHLRDKRPYLYDLDELEQAQSHDPLWNAAQNELVRTGRMHNYLRMLWGKKILEWTASPREALQIMIELNNKYALDGRDPNSYSGIFWCLGRFDRPWGPERPIFGSIRYMSSENTARKFNVKNYVRLYGDGGSQPELKL